MQGSSRASAAHGQRALDALLAGGPGRTVDPAALADDLFGVSGALDSSAALRRALTDPTREAGAKGDLVRRLLADKVSATALQVVTTLVGQRWSAERDLVDTVENFAVQSLAAGAESRGRADTVEDELFRFERIVAGDTALRDTLSSRNTDGEGKAGVVATLLEGKAHPETVRLAQQAVRVPRGRRLDRVLAAYLDLAANRRDELTALVTVASALTEQQAARLRTQLETMYGKSVSLQTVVDPHVLGGIRVQVGDEVMDGTISRRIDQARRHVTGN